MLSTITLFIEFLVLAFMKSSSYEERPAALIIVFIALFSFSFLYDVSRSAVLRKYSAPLFCGYLFRLFLLFFDVYGRNIYSLPGSGADSEMFYYNAVQFINGLNGRSGAFITLTGTIMKWVGVSRLFVQFILMLFSMVAIIFAARTMEYVVADKRTKQVAVFILCLLPNFAILSCIYLRESVIAMLLSISFYCFVRWVNRGREGFFWFAFVFVFAAARFHSGVVGVAMGYIAARMLYDKEDGRFEFAAKSAITAAFFLLVFAYLYLNYADTLFGKMVNIESVEDIASGVGRGGSSYAQYVGDSSTPLNMVIYTIPRMLYFLFSPFPWQWRGLSDIIAFCFSSLFFLWTAINTVRYLKNKYPENRAVVMGLSIVALCTLFIFAWGTSNTGTAIRHRDKAIVLYGILWCCTRIPRTSRRCITNGKSFGNYTGL